MKLLTQLHRYTEAMQCYEKSEKLGFDSQLDIIGLFGQMGKYSEVIKRSEEIIRSEDRWSSDLSDRKIGAMFFKANALDALGNFDEAIKYYDQVISDLILPSPSALYYRGRSKVKNGDMNGLPDLKEAIEIEKYRYKDKYRKLANSDKDFESIRNDAVFRSIVTKP